MILESVLESHIGLKIHLKKNHLLENNFNP